MKRSILLNIRENRLLKAYFSWMQQISKVLLSLFLFVSSNFAKAQSPCDSFNLTYSTTWPTCYGSANGTINLTVHGATTPVSYSWNTGASTEDLSGLAASVYTVTATDQNGCSATTAVTIGQPGAINTTLDVHNVLCNGETNGYIVSHVSGGTSPYNYFWSNGDQTNYDPDLSAGTYYLTVVDYLGCTKRDTATVTQPGPIVLDLTSPQYENGFNISYYMANDGSVDMSVSGGLAPYWYAWSNGASTEDIGNLSANVYSVLVKDANGCTVSGTIALDQPVMVAMPSAFSPNSDGNNDNFVVHGAEAFPDNVLTVFNRWGNIVYQHENYSGEWNGHNNKGEELPDGTYFAIMEIKSKDMTFKGYVEMKRH